MDRDLPLKYMDHLPLHYYAATTTEDIFAIKICLMIIAACLILISLTIFIPACWSLLSKISWSCPSWSECQRWRNEQIEKAEKNQNLWLLIYSENILFFRAVHNFLIWCLAKSSFYKIQLPICPFSIVICILHILFYGISFMRKLLLEKIPLLHYI